MQDQMEMGERVANGALLESGMIKPGATLVDSRNRWQATVRIDGSLEHKGESASIHRMGAKVQGLDACNGWAFWHVRFGKKLTCIDDLRTEYREVNKLV